MSTTASSSGSDRRNCLFCKIVSGEAPAKVLREGQRTVAIWDINPQAPIHVLVIPREHHATAAAAAAADPELAAELLREAGEVAAAQGIAESGYRIVFNTGSGAGQTILHVHAHVLGGRRLGWPPG